MSQLEKLKEISKRRPAERKREEDAGQKKQRAFVRQIAKVKFYWRGTNYSSPRVFSKVKREMQGTVALGDIAGKVVYPFHMNFASMS